MESYDFLEGECPDTVHPSLWRQSRLNRIAGLFEIEPGFYQLRGFDLSNMHVPRRRRAQLAAINATIEVDFLGQCAPESRGSDSAAVEPEHQLVRVAPAPVLARLDRADDRVPRRLVVRRRVFPLRVVAATDVAAGLAHPQVDPAHPQRQALLAAGDLLGQIEELNRVEMGAFGGRLPKIHPARQTRAAFLRL
jgi:hypothetical protein